MSGPSGGKQPATWQDYESSRGSPGSDSHIHWAGPLDRQESGTSTRSYLAVPHQNNHDERDSQLRRRRSSLAMRMSALRQAGGVNSFDNFARSWQRAAGFYEITSSRPSFRFTEGEGEPSYTKQDIEQSPEATRSLLHAALQDDGGHVLEHAVSEEAIATTDSASREGTSEPLEHRIDDLRRRYSRGNSIFSIEPSLASPFGGSYGTMYGSLASHVNETSMRHAARLFNEQQVKGITEPDREREPLLVKQVEEEGKTYNVVVGQSTLPQTIFNSVNVLVGVGLLSLPLGFRYSGWIVGSLFFIFSVVSTQYTAKILAKCLDVDSSLITFADLAYVSFGHSARIVTSILFSLELIGANVALVILFGDSLDALIPGWGITVWKVICCIILIPLMFLPLRLLSFTSILGILCCLGIVIAVFIDGLIKPHRPGSLRDPATTYLFPQSWLTIPLSFGLLMSPWGGHSVFPNIYRDMRHPHRYRKAVNTTYLFTFVLDLGMAVVGLLMFGDWTRDEITSNILLTRGYPKAISVFIVVAIAIIPITKVPLNSRPIISSLEILTGIDARALSPSSSLQGMSGFTRGSLKAAIRILTTILFVGIAVVFPSFDRIMALLGAVCCFSICLIMPLSFHLKLFGKEISRTEWWTNLVLIVVCTVMAVVSTVFACLPKEMLGAEMGDS